MDKLISGLFILLFAPIAMGFGDPTQPQLQTAVTKEPTARTISNPQPLTAIFTRDKKRYAIIDDRIYHLGDHYRGAKIVGISDDKVTLSSAEGTRHLTLFQKIKK